MTCIGHPKLFLPALNFQDTLLLTIISILLQASTSAFTTTRATVLILIILLLLILQAISAGGKTAIFSLKAKDINYLKTKDNISSRRLMKLLAQPRLLFASTVAATTFFSIAIIIVCHQLASIILPQNLGPTISLIIEILCISVLLILLGMVLPRVYAVQNNVRMALVATPVLGVLKTVFKPFASLLISSDAFLEDKLYDERSIIESNEFNSTIEQTVGFVTSTSELNIFKGILRFGDVKAKQVMTSRLNMVAINETASTAELYNLARAKGLSRIPVYAGNMDNITGVINSRDLLPHMDDLQFDWTTLKRTILFVPEDKPVGTLMKEFQSQKKQMAVVVDEFGGTSGLVTLEDIIEEITGDIKDEFEHNTPLFQKMDEHNYVFDGRISINDLCRVADLPLNTFDNVRSHSDTIAGMITDQLGRFPQLNESVIINNYEFIAIDVQRTRVQSIKMTKPI